MQSKYPFRLLYSGIESKLKNEEFSIQIQFNQIEVTFIKSLTIIKHAERYLYLIFSYHKSFYKHFIYFFS